LDTFEHMRLVDTSGPRRRWKPPEGQASFWKIQVVKHEIAMTAVRDQLSLEP